MTLRSTLDSLDALAARLPFSIDDMGQVNHAFAQWHQEGRAEILRIVDLWTYCYVRRYYLHKFIRSEEYRIADLDALIDKTYRKVLQKRGSIRQTNKYAHWISVVCRNTYLNHLRSRRRFVSVDDEHAPVLQADTEVSVSDLGAIRRALEEAIGRLPTFLQEVARLRLLHDHSYQEISAAVDKSLPVVRSYTFKALTRLREDRVLRMYLGQPEED